MDRSKDFRIRQIIQCIDAPGAIINLGCAGNFDLHRLLDEHSTVLLGIDLEEEPLERFREAGFQVQQQNVEQLVCTDVYDYAVAGELIEHVNNAGLFLQATGRCLKPGGKLIITTPNISSIFNIVTVLAREAPQDPTHICYFDRAHLKNLLGRFADIYQLNKVEFIPPNIQYRGNIVTGTLHFMMTLLAYAGYRVFPRFFASYILVELERR